MQYNLHHFFVHPEVSPFLHYNLFRVRAVEHKYAGNGRTLRNSLTNQHIPCIVYVVAYFMTIYNIIVSYTGNAHQLSINIIMCNDNRSNSRSTVSTVCLSLITFPPRRPSSEVNTKELLQYINQYRRLLILQMVYTIS